MTLQERREYLRALKGIARGEYPQWVDAYLRGRHRIPRKFDRRLFNEAQQRERAGNLAPCDRCGAVFEIERRRYNGEYVCKECRREVKNGTKPPLRGDRPWWSEQDKYRGLWICPGRLMRGFDQQTCRDVGPLVRIGYSCERCRKWVYRHREEVDAWLAARDLPALR